MRKFFLKNISITESNELTLSSETFDVSGNYTIYYNSIIVTGAYSNNTGIGICIFTNDGTLVYWTSLIDPCTIEYNVVNLDPSTLYYVSVNDPNQPQSSEPFYFQPTPPPVTESDIASQWKQVYDDNIRVLTSGLYNDKVENYVYAYGEVPLNLSGIPNIVDNEDTYNLTSTNPVTTYKVDFNQNYMVFTDNNTNSSTNDIGINNCIYSLDLSGSNMYIDSEYIVLAGSSVQYDFTINDISYNSGIFYITNTQSSENSYNFVYGYKIQKVDFDENNNLRITCDLNYTEHMGLYTQGLPYPSNNSKTLTIDGVEYTCEKVGITDTISSVYTETTETELIIIVEEVGIQTPTLSSCIIWGSNSSVLTYPVNYYTGKVEMRVSLFEPIDGLYYSIYSYTTEPIQCTNSLVISKNAE